MPFGLLTTCIRNVDNDSIEKVSARLFEDAEKIRQTFQLVVTTIIGSCVGIVLRQENQRINEILRMAEYEINLPDSGSCLAAKIAITNDTMCWQSRGESHLNDLFANTRETVVSVISGYSGVMKTSVDTIMKITAPLVLRELGKHVGEKKMDTAQASLFIKDQKSTIKAAIPEKISILLYLLDIESNFNVIREDKKLPNFKSKTTYPTRKEHRAGFSSLPVLAGIIILTICFFYNGCTKAATGSKSFIGIDSKFDKP